MEKDGKGDKQYKTNSRVGDDTEKVQKKIEYRKLMQKKKILENHRKNEDTEKTQKRKSNTQRKHIKNENTEKT